MARELLERTYVNGDTCNYGQMLSDTSNKGIEVFDPLLDSDSRILLTQWPSGIEGILCAQKLETVAIK
jgi:hypothetical protein